MTSTEPGPSLIQELDTVDRAVYQTIGDVQTPLLDGAMARLSNAANHSRLWLGCALVMAVIGGRPGRRGARVGLASIGLASVVSNLVVKPLSSRRRPDRDPGVVPRGRWVRMPTSPSLPSGHSASAFAFATAVGQTIPAASVPLNVAAAAVAYSRVHTGVHYPADTIVGAAIGVSAAQIVCHVLDPGRMARRALSRSARPGG
jgi:undecaprenyl-diphosphatase